MNLVIANHQRTKKINTHWLKQIAGEIFLELKVSPVELGINLVGAKEMAKINRRFLQHEGPTDVITFDYLALESKIRNPALKLHGELFICVTEAVSQARDFKTDWQSEVVRYIVHGILHLLGHDDLKPPLRRRMKREENRLVRHLSKRFSFAQTARAAKLGA